MTLWYKRLRKTSFDPRALSDSFFLQPTLSTNTGTDTGQRSLSSDQATGWTSLLLWYTALTV